MPRKSEPCFLEQLSELGPGSLQMNGFFLQVTVNAFREESRTKHDLRATKAVKIAMAEDLGRVHPQKMMPSASQLG